MTFCEDCGTEAYLVDGVVCEDCDSDRVDISDGFCKECWPTRRRYAYCDELCDECYAAQA